MGYFRPKLKALSRELKSRPRASGLGAWGPNPAFDAGAVSPRELGKKDLMKEVFIYWCCGDLYFNAAVQSIELWPIPYKICEAFCASSVFFAERRLGQCTRWPCMY